MDISSTDSDKSALNRSYSFSGSPITQKLCLKQSFRNKKGETLIRQYSCEQINDHSKKNPKIQYKESVFVQSPRKLKKLIPSLNYQTDLERFPFNLGRNNFFNFNKNCPEQEGFEKSLNLRNKDCIPMEVDTSTEDHSMTDVHSPCKIQGDIEMTENEEHKSKVSKMIIPPMNRVEKTGTTKNSKSFKQYLKLILVFLIPVIFAIIFNVTVTDKSYLSNNFDSNNITNALQNLLYGQQEVLHKLKESFHNIRDHNLIVFIGGVGVGKTYSANIISNNFPWKKNIIKFVSPQLKNQYINSNSLSNDGYNLVIVDNLEFDNQSVIQFIKEVFECEKKVILILIYTIPDRSFDISKDFINLDIKSCSKEISENLFRAKLQHTLITFNKLNSDVVRKCIHYAMSKKGIVIEQFNVDYVLENVNYEYSGCKGVYTKVALLK